MRLNWIATAVVALNVLVASAYAEDDAVSILREDWKDTARDRIVPVRIDYPAKSDSPLPVVILSHGLGGSRENLKAVSQYWAAHGYVVIHLQHIGSDESAWQGKAPQEAIRDLKSAANAKQFALRNEDVKFALDDLVRKNSDKNWPLAGKLDLEKIAMGGHSFGAVTTQAMCGQTYITGKRYIDPRIKVGIAFSPSAAKAGDQAKAFSQMTLPMFYMTGTNDNSPIVGDTKAPDRRVPFDNSHSADAYLTIITDATHMAMGGGALGHPEWQTLINVGTTAFLDKYLKHDSTAAKFLDDGEYAKQAKALGTFEMKKVK